MIQRIPQRAKDDCAICVVAMVMGPPYSYERVTEDSLRYPKVTSEGKFPAWWETYLRDERFDICYCRFDGLHALPDYAGTVVEFWVWIFLISGPGISLPWMRSVLSIRLTTRQIISGSIVISATGCTTAWCFTKNGWQ